MLDLTECQIMDSTFLGILARFGLTLTNQTEPVGLVQIVNPNDRILGLLQNLGVDHLFKVLTGAKVPSPNGATDLELSTCTDKVEATRTSLVAHETLSQLSPENAARFKDVIRFVAEDLKGQEEGTASPPPKSPPA